MVFRTLMAVAGVIAMAVSIADPAMADQLSDIRSRGKLVCGVLGGYEPFSFQDPITREVNGYEPDVCRGLAQALGVTIELRVVTAQGRVPELLQGRVDVEAALLGWSREREKQVDFSHIYAEVDSKMLVMKVSGVATGAQLEERKIGVAKGSSLESIAQSRFPKATIVSYDDTPAAYLSLRQGKIAALLMTETTLQSLRRLDPQSDRTSLLSEVYERGQEAFVVRKGDNETLLAAINVYLDAIERSGEAQTLYDRWFGSDSKLKMTRAIAVGTPIERE